MDIMTVLAIFLVVYHLTAGIYGTYRLAKLSPQPVNEEEELLLFIMQFYLAIVAGPIMLVMAKAKEKDIANQKQLEKEREEYNKTLPYYNEGIRVENPKEIICSPNHIR